MGVDDDIVDDVLTTLKQNGHTAKQLREAGYTSKQLREKGFTAKQLKAGR